MTFIVNTAVGFPAHYYSQEVLANALRKYFIVQELDFDLDAIDRFFTNVLIKGRYFMLPLDSFYEPPGIEENINATIKATVDLVEETVWKLLKKTALEPQDISQLTATSLIPAVPGIDVRLMNRIPFSPNIKRMPLGGVGCMGGAFGVARVADYLKAYPTQASILVASEPSSSLWQGSLQRDLCSMIRRLPDDPSQYSDIIMTIITAALFGDGSAAVLMVGDDHPLAQAGCPQVIDSRSMLLPNTVHLMGMDVVDTGTRNILRPEVSDHVRVGLRQTIDPLLEAHNLSVDDISRWLVHPGGPKIINAIEDEYGLDDQALNLSREVLAEVGNLSSPTILYILDKTLSAEQPSSGSYGLMIAMGPGFSQEVILLQW
ncbi:type III polyketide synthase [Aphanothece sacrum]|uniref:3-oxoacyl-(Acyl-carrier-protein (ACP)) synthase III domain protein n=1 Tax=Aphanothece sacrum FPU1 TaxID=1920663 RepID=A0A401IH30_APHSA|nr:3-oxoacyl-[acyl-carrier-protein] synthase III C-terminal domain-containing protein [Aphanothece sacrum]GBF80597.1 3-oxoacyl-(Acyl-carrier-protein (ACP)) synthase III domain protein [Aphanothece sacrum FPU1]GBF84013.1 3-oxoacyl-(Acyl-carrier-protein (ACP)) synthase III domain protein [Aphanothece sacrum FPU3]